MAGGLTQVLADGNQTYLYGVNRIAQVSPTQTGYFLPDVLGSVRQIANGNTSVDIVLAQTYTPYGEVLESYGAGVSGYAFTGEMYDPQTGLVYLRARYYAPGDGRFVSRDTWTGKYNNPQSLNRWAYVEGNPINRSDPSGYCWYPNLNSGGIFQDFTSLPISKICPWFVEALKPMGWSIPYDARPDTWADYIPESDRDRIIIRTNGGQSFFSGDYGKTNPLWVIVQYGKSVGVNPYSETPRYVPLNQDVGLPLPMHQDVGVMFPVGGIPVVAEVGGGVAMRCEYGKGCHDLTQAYTHVGVGAVPLSAGLQIGDGIGLYVEAEFFERDCGMKLSYPDVGVYSPVGEVGLSFNITPTRWILTTEQSIMNYGGYMKFGLKKLSMQGDFSYAVYDQDFNRTGLLGRWNLKMAHFYKLEEIH
jgi:RHS repeat-associated protein